MPHKTPPESDWIIALSDFLASQSGVEAIRLNPEERSVQVATLGQVDLGALQTQINELLRTLDEKLLATPIDAHAEGLQLTRKEGELLLQKPTCPTAPRFWKWRDFEWPEAEAIEQQSDEEWREMAVQATICFVMLVAGFVAKNRFHASEWLVHSLFGLSLLSGGWDAAKDAWENLRERRLDVHFLMLAVAAGAAMIGAWWEGAALLFLFSLSGALEAMAMHQLLGFFQ